jgi:tRNA-2-methylthio-N6-dimethylallyladenosine synthase
LTSLFREYTHKIHYLSFPIQSGSDRILTLLNRNYTSAQLRDSFSQLRQACPDIILDTQVIVGFPSETKDDMDATIDILREIAFHRVTTYQYADRPNTPASAMSGKHTDETIRFHISDLREKCRSKTLVANSL